MIKPISILLSLCLLCSCSAALPTNDMLSPPRLTTQQSDIYDALESAIGTRTFKFKYPRRGKYLSACILHDLDKDGTDEAIAFYELTVAGVTSTWMSLLDEEDGSWKSIKELPAAGVDIDSVTFAPVTNKTRDNIIVGWSVAGKENNSCVIYSYENRQLNATHEIELPYNELLVDNIDDNDLQELVLCTKSASRPAGISIVKLRGGRIVITSKVELPAGTIGFSQVLFGPLTTGLSAVFADILLDGGGKTTKIAVVEKAMVTELTEEDLGIYESFDRSASALDCSDINGDGLIDIPVNYPLPGYENVREGDKLERTEYKSIINSTLSPVGNAIVNRREGYQLLIPDSWVGMVTVRVQPDTGEWRFCFYSGELVTSTSELLRIKVVSPAIYQDKLETATYRTLATKGVYDYTAYIPPEQFPGYSISYEMLGRIFSLHTTE